VYEIDPSVLKCALLVTMLTKKAAALEKYSKTRIYSKFFQESLFTIGKNQYALMNFDKISSKNLFEHLKNKYSCNRSHSTQLMKKILKIEFLG